MVTLAVDAELLDRVGMERLHRLHAAILHQLRTLPQGGTVEATLTAKTGGVVSDSHVGHTVHIG